jgi:catechol 2,3-dioxygenase-like lactoylglutathione lyase family enzyme
MALSITHTPVYCTDLDEALAFYTQRLGFEVHDDVPMGPEMRWLTVHAPGESRCAPPGRRSFRSPLTSPTASATLPFATPAATICG